MPDGRNADQVQGPFEVENTPRITRAGLFVWTMGWTRAEWKSLLAALAISLLVHAFVLGTARPVRVGDGRTPVLSVTLTGAFVAPRAPAITAPPPAAAKPAPAAPRQASPAPSFALPAPKAPSADTSAVAVAPPTRSQEDATPPRPRTVAPPGLDERGFVPADALAQPPNPVSSPEVGDVARKVMGRRLQTTLWIEADGTVRKAFVKRNELPDDVAVLLEQALATVRFTPGRIGDHAVPTILNARLCFDDAGVLDTTTSDCLRPAAPDAQAQGRSPAEQGEAPPPR